MIPKWVKDLVKQVALDEGRTDIPEIKWRKSKDLTRECTSGVTYTTATPVKIRIVAGSNKREQKWILLHELCHWLTPNGEHHSIVFYDKAFELYRRYRIPMKWASLKEGAYRKKSIQSYKKNELRRQADLTIARASR